MKYREIFLESFVIDVLSYLNRNNFNSSLDKARLAVLLVTYLYNKNNHVLSYEIGIIEMLTGDEKYFSLKIRPRLKSENIYNQYLSAFSYIDSKHNDIHEILNDLKKNIKSL